MQSINPNSSVSYQNNSFSHQKISEKDSLASEIAKQKKNRLNPRDALSLSPFRPKIPSKPTNVALSILNKNAKDKRFSSYGDSLDSLFKNPDSDHSRLSNLNSILETPYVEDRSFRKRVTSPIPQRSFISFSPDVTSSLNERKEGICGLSLNGSPNRCLSTSPLPKSLKGPSLVIPGRLSILIDSPSPQTPENYAMQAVNIRECRFILNQEGEPCQISDEKSAKKGSFSCVYNLVYPLPRICSDIPNEEIVVKILQEKHIRKATKYIGYSIIQYKKLSKFFENEESPPIVKIYNPESAAACGFTLVEKVTPLTSPPWDRNTSIDKLEEQGRKTLDSIQKLIKTNIPLDLKWNNLGVKKDGTVVLLDYDNIPFTMNLTDSYSRRLSGDNPQIAEYIKKIEIQLKEKVPLK